ncbi:hypothetical protein EMO89_01655 [Bifidobacterium tissieri]|uniref:NodB homology domain-containing protein n=1 Tax=Bifidobacterium tissieri TaxID=1630162 RepID=A0A5M9ZV06_9BIFI|nr:hypothetical protein [Bifidobacterium tissieri]KAA8831466.1 hypothetical protein EMO89_01655 [Bifidobacterium tissieri]
MLDDSHVRYATQAVKMTAEAGKTVTANLFPDYRGKASSERVGLWVWVGPENMPTTSSGSIYTSVTVGRGNGGGNGVQIIGTDRYKGLRPGWNLCVCESQAYAVGLTVQFRSESGGSIWVDSLIVEPDTPKPVIVFTHDVAPGQVTQDMIDMYQSRGLVFTWDQSNDSNWTADQVAHLLSAGVTDGGVYSGHPEDIDYDTGDWTVVAERMKHVRDIPSLPRASYVASTRNQLGKAYLERLSGDGWPLIRGNYGGGLGLTIDPTYRSVPTIGYEDASTKLDTYVELGAIIVITEHKIVADGEGSGTTQIEVSKWTALLDHVKELVDAGKVECLTMRQLAERYVPHALTAWDAQGD